MSFGPTPSIFTQSALAADQARAKRRRRIYLPSSDPPVLAVAAGDSQVTDLTSLDNEGKHLTTVSLSGYDASCEDAGTIAPAAVVSCTPRTKKETPFLFFRLPEEEVAELGDPEQSDIIVEKVRVFLAKRELVHGDEYPVDPVLMAIGTGSAGLQN